MQDNESEVTCEKPIETFKAFEENWSGRICLKGAQIFIATTASIILEGRPAGWIMGDASGREMEKGVINTLALACYADQLIKTFLSKEGKFKFITKIK